MIQWLDPLVNTDHDQYLPEGKNLILVRYYNFSGQTGHDWSNYQQCLITFKFVY